MYIQLLMLNIISLSYGSKTYFDSPCPDVKAIGNFDFARYSQGIWYEISRYPNDWQGDEDCAYIRFDKQGDVTTFKSVGVSNRQNQIVEGTLRLAKDAGTNGILILKSNTFVEKEDGELLPYYVLDTDYDKYAICYECKYDKINKRRQDFAWIDSRTKELDSDTRKIVDDFIKASNILDAKYFIWDNFSSDTCKTN